MNDAAHGTETETPHDHADHEGVIICSHVHSGERPALLALRSHEDWVLQIMCGQWDHDDEDGAALACADCLIIRDPSLVAILGLEAGYLAERPDAGSEWEIEEYDEDEYEDEEIAVSDDEPVPSK